MTIYIIALIVVGLVAAWWFIRQARDASRLASRLHARRMADYEREDLMREKFDDTTRLYDDTMGPK